MGLSEKQWNKLSFEEQSEYTRNQFEKLDFKIQEFLISKNVIIGGDGTLYPNKIILTIYPDTLSLCMPTKKNPYGYVSTLKLDKITLLTVKKMYICLQQHQQE